MTIFNDVHQMICIFTEGDLCSIILVFCESRQVILDVVVESRSTYRFVFIVDCEQGKSGRGLDKCWQIQVASVHHEMDQLFKLY